jgi:carboxymethylenebutenolidase
MSTHRVDRLPLGDGEMDVHVWTPASGSGPGLLLLQEIFGIGEHIRSVADRLSAGGYVAAAPDVFWRIAPGWERPADEAGTADSLPLVGQLDFPQAIADCASALEHLEALPEVSGRPGVIGFCLGGTLAYGVAIAAEPTACVSYYGSGVPSMLDRLPSVNCPTLFHFGSRDPYIAGEGIEAVAAAIAGHPRFRLNVEIAGHAFDNEAPMYHDEGAARSAWAKTVAFLSEQLPVSS